MSHVEIRTFIFNSKQLLPWHVAEKLAGGDIFAASDWCEKDQHAHRFQPNDEVADKMYPQHKMTVKEIKYQSHNVDEERKERKNRIIGIECYWFVDLEGEKIEKEIQDT